MTARHTTLLAFGLAAFVGLFLIVPMIGFAQNPGGGGTAPGGLIPCEGKDCDFDSLLVLIKNIINFLILIIAAPISALLFMWAGFTYLTAGGDMGKVKKAHSIFMNVAVGLFIALGAWLLVNFLVQAFVKEPTLFI